MMKAIVAIVILACAVGLAWANPGASPGKLARVHARFEAQCDRCHDGGAVPANRCLDCHVKLADKINAGVGYHATVTKQACVACHQDHEGRDAKIQPDPPANFDHRVATFSLAGKHAQLACTKCHAAGKWVGVAATCARCHKDKAHKGTFGSDCAKCHRADSWTPATRTAADHQVSLAGGHGQLGCVDCHRGGRHLVAKQTCAQCHKQPHGGTKAACETCHPVTAWKQPEYTHTNPAARLGGAHDTASCLTCHPKFVFKPTPTACVDCHDKQRPHEPMGACPTCHTTTTWRTKTFDHAAPSVGFALTGKHLSAPCAGCHPTKVDWNAPVRGCLDCHTDPHGTQFKGNVCTECHTTSGFVPSLIDVDKHDLFAFPLKASHRQTTCAKCHRGGVFIGISQTCVSCHDDRRHNGRFGAQCQDCHDVTTWKHVTGFDHKLTGFVLENKHATVACDHCHGADGKALAKSKAPTDCRTCHATPHDRHFPQTCSTCHSTQGWPKVARYDHDETDFPLELRHTTLKCQSCHDAQRKPPITRACRSCHGDPHRGSNAYDCDDCHRADRWRVIRFDHDVTAYPLSGRHRVAACGDCHTNPNWTGVRTDCVACHAFDRPRTDSHPPEPECEDCHNQWRWRTVN